MPVDVAALFHEHHAELYRYAVRLTGDPDVAKDSVQTAFVRLLDTDDPPERPRPWLFRVVTNHVRERGRTEARRRELAEARGDATEVGDPHPTPDVHLERDEARRAARRILDRLDERDRTVLLMREGGFSHREIAEAIGTTTGSVGTMIARALRKCATIVREED